MSTRDRIVDTALRLFNEQGTCHVSTNHIAAALGISPGNLYYHFRNKEEIISAIFERMSVVWGAPSTRPTDRPTMLDDLRQLVRDSFAVLWDYRFIYRELLALLADNPALRKRGMAGVEEAIRYFIATDMLRVPDANRAVPQLAQVCWIIAEFWLPFADLDPEPVGSAQMEQGADLLISALRPYLTEHALASGATRDGGRNAQENTDA